MRIAVAVSGGVDSLCALLLSDLVKHTSEVGDRRLDASQ